MGALERLALGADSPIIRRTVPVTTPAAGAQWSVTVPGDQIWRILGIRATLTMSAVAGGRVPSITITDGNAVVLGSGMAIAETANAVVNHTWMPGGGVLTPALATETMLPLPPNLIVGPGSVIASQVGSMDVGDAWSGIRVWVDQIAVGISAWSLAREAVEDVYEEPTAFL